VFNTAVNPITLYWIDESTGEALYSSPYATLEQGESYSDTFWFAGHRIMITDSANTCIGVLELNNTSNIFVL